jgi:MYXO-CTERM domain-containing protein
VHHTNGPTVEQGDGIEIKEGSYNNVIRDNVIHDTNYPCILTYSTVGNGAPNVIERNALWNCGDHAIQAAADAVIRNNIILGSGSDGIAMQPHQSGMPANLVVLHNTVLHPMNAAISASGIAGSLLIANNALYAQNGNAISLSGELGQVVSTGNFGLGSFQGAAMEFMGTGALETDFAAASFSGTPPNDVFPAPGSGLIVAGDSAHAALDDFNGTPREGAPDAGAYRFDPSGNPGWPLGADPKGETLGGGSGGSAGAGDVPGSGAATAGVNAGGAEGGSSNPGGSAGAGVAGSRSSSDGGCACRLQGAGPSRSAAWVLMLFAVSIGRKRAWAWKGVSR